MLAERQIMIDSTHDRITWEDKDWDLLAAELKRQHPKRITSSTSRFEFTTMELEDAAEVVIPQERQRSFQSFDDVRRPLFYAFERMKPDAKKVVQVHEGKSDVNGRIHWSPEEWEAVALELERMIPGVFERRCNGVGIVQVNAAQAILPVHRRRIFGQVVGFRASILKIWENVQAARKDQAPPAIVDFPSGPVMEPPSRKSDDNSAIATAIHKAFQAGPTEKKARKTKVYWTPEEWLAIAREMRRQNPHYNFFASKFNIIDLAGIRDAQREVLPISRRKVLAGQKGLQEPLVNAFKMLLEEVSKENEERKQTVEPAVSDLLEEVADPIDKIAEVVKVADFQTPAPIVSTAPSDFLSRVTQAAVPLMDVLVSEVVKRLLPELSAQLMPELTKSISSIVQTAMDGLKPASQPLAAPMTNATPFSVVASQPLPAQLSAKEISALFPTPEPKPKKKKIVLVGPTGRQRQDIETSFPQFRFIFIEHGHGIKEAAVDCELFVVYTSHFNAANKAAVKKYVPHEKVRQVAGSVSSVKHQIHAWMASNLVQNNAN